MEKPKIQFRCNRCHSLIEIEYFVSRRNRCPICGYVMIAPIVKMAKLFNWLIIASCISFVLNVCFACLFFDDAQINNMECIFNYITMDMPVLLSATLLITIFCLMTGLVIFNYVILFLTLCTFYQDFKFSVLVGSLSFLFLLPVPLVWLILFCIVSWKANRLLLKAGFDVHFWGIARKDLEREL